ncbi:MAG: nucleoside deaminase [Burkholderiaceae bacterium]
MTITSKDDEPMRMAIAAARAALAKGNKPYGATLASANGKIMHTAGNNELTGGDCTAHAEMVLVREAQAAFGISALQGGTVHASGEPCAMCCGALFWAGVARIVYGAPNRAMGEQLGGAVLPVTCAELLAHAVPAVQVDGPLLADESLLLLRAAATRLSK